MSGTLVSSRLRHLSVADRGRIEDITRAVGLFRDDEIPVALEVFDEAVREGGSQSYTALGADVDGRLVGWICWGPTPCTLGTYDLYWMAVDPALQGGGITHQRSVGIPVPEVPAGMLAGDSRTVV